MYYLIGVVFILIAIGQFIMTQRTFANLKKDGDKNVSPFIMLGLWSSLAFAIVFITVGIAVISMNI